MFRAEGGGLEPNQAGFPTTGFQDRPTTNYHILPRT